MSENSNSTKTKNYSRKDSSQISELYSVRGDPHKIIASVIGNDFLEYRKLWEETVNFKRVLNYPLHIDFEISYNCNYKCQMCVLNLPKEDKKKYGDPSQKLDFEVFKRIINEGVELGLKSVGFNGLNEPLLEKDLIKWINYAKDKNILDIMFNTNGSLLNSEIAEQLINSGLTRIMISIDATTQETYEKVRSSVDLNKVVKNVKGFIKIRDHLGKKLPIVRVSFVKMNNNIHELDDFIKMWKDEVDFFSIQTFGNPLIPGDNYYEEFEKFHVNKGKEIIDFKCPEPWVRLLIRHNGDINPCCGIQGVKHIMGNVYKDNIKDVWKSNEMNLLRKLHKEGRYKENLICKLCAESLRYE